MQGDKSLHSALV